MTCRVLTFNPHGNRFPKRAAAGKREWTDLDFIELQLSFEIGEAVQRFFAYRKQWVDPPSDGEWGRAG